jgi:queuine tRNA-ribosyltransferase
LIRFSLQKKDRGSEARLGTLSIRDTTTETPVFMPVGTAAAVKAMTTADLLKAGAPIVLSNTYHLMLQPGEALIRKAGGLHRFMGWPRGILTDSGGFQVFSLPSAEILEEGVRFRPPGSAEPILLSPELSIAVQEALGADIIMTFDECLPYPCERAYAAEGVARTLRWAKRCKDAKKRDDQALFGICQGSVYPELRMDCARALVDLDFSGYAVGGVSVGEGHDLLKKTVEITCPHLPASKPRYLMGVGLPEDILVSIERGIDMFDCVIPTRFARSATAFTRMGKLRLTSPRFRKDLYPIDTACACYACTTFTRAYLHHLFVSNEILSAMLLSIHNVTFFLDLVKEAREAIRNDGFIAFKERFLERYLAKDRSAPESWRRLPDTDAGESERSRDPLRRRR